MKHIVYSLALISALLLSGCGDNNDGDEVSSLGTSSLTDRNTSKELTDDTNTTQAAAGKQWEMLTLRSVTDDVSTTGRISYEEAVQRCVDDGRGMKLPTIEELKSIDTIALKANAGFGFQEAVKSSGYDQALIIWAQDRKGYVLYSTDTKDKEYTGGDATTRFYTCVKQK